jgi:hypothetical protein
MSLDTFSLKLLLIWLFSLLFVKFICGKAGAKNSFTPAVVFKRGMIFSIKISSETSVSAR